VIYLIFNYVGDAVKHSIKYNDNLYNAIFL